MSHKLLYNIVLQYSNPLNVHVDGTLAQLISDYRRRIVDMTSIDSRFFMVRSPSCEQIQLFDTKEFKQQQALEVKDLSDDL
jgi:hypothetical protein